MNATCVWEGGRGASGRRSGFELRAEVGLGGDWGHMQRIPMTHPHTPAQHNNINRYIHGTDLAGEVHLVRAGVHGRGRGVLAAYAYVWYGRSNRDRSAQPKPNPSANHLVNQHLIPFDRSTDSKRQHATYRAWTTAGLLSPMRGATKAWAHPAARASVATTWVFIFSAAVCRRWVWMCVGGWAVGLDESREFPFGACALLLPPPAWVSRSRNNEPKRC